jgi:hypothetical protein
VRALFRNGGGVFGHSGFCVRHGGESFVRLVGARRSITLVGRKCKGIVGVIEKASRRENCWRWPSASGAGFRRHAGVYLSVWFGTDRGFDSDIEIAIQRLPFP